MYKKIAHHSKYCNNPNCRKTAATLKPQKFKKYRDNVLKKCEDRIPNEQSLVVETKANIAAALKRAK